MTRKFHAPSPRRKSELAFMQMLDQPPHGTAKRTKRQQRKIEAAVKRSRVASDQYEKRGKR